MRSRERDVPGCFLGEDENECTPIKIGVATNTGSRKRNLQTGHPLELCLQGWIDEAEIVQLKRRRHRHLCAMHVRGE